MCRYFMELPSSDYVTIQTAYNYIKKTYPHLTNGFNMQAGCIHSFRYDYSAPVFTWWNDNPFLGWGTRGGIRVPFPDVNCIVLGDIE